ncbi:MAG TPA: nuclear transport factor 2 family protein [Pseudonocardia sp.]|jgi:ketosteroid isomerase-like protein
MDWSKVDGEARIDLLVQKAQIEEVNANYCWGLDTRDTELFLSVFHEDGIWDFGAAFGTFAGKEAIRAGFAATLGMMAEMHHLTADIVLDIDGDNATGRSHAYGRAIFAGTEQPHRLVAHYNDTYARRDGRWGFLHRRITMYPPFPRPGGDS